MAIKINFFKGISPKTEPLLLSDNSAVVSTNARLDSGHIEPFKAPLNHTTVSTLAKSIYRYGNQWLSWDTDVNVIRTPVVVDQYQRIYYTGDGDPKYTYQGRPSGNTANGFLLGLPAPSTIPSASPLASSGTIEELRTYVYTYVTALGEEGQPSLPSTSITVWDEGQVNITFTTESLTNYNLGSNAFRRLYRTATTISGTEFQYVADIPIGTLTYSDTKTSSQLGEVIPSTDWEKPPQASGIGALSGITSMPNSYLVGFTGNTLCFSEVAIPSAWPPSYRLSFDSDIVAIGKSGNSIIVLTKEYPYLVTGSEPAGMSAIRMETAQACVSKKSVVDIGSTVFYVSPDGLVGASENGVALLTGDLFTRNQWQALNPASMIGMYYEDMYVCFSDTTAFIIDKTGLFSYLTGFSAINSYIDLENDKLYLLQSLGNVSIFNEGQDLSISWKSKPFRSATKETLTAARVDCSSGMVFKLFADGQLVHTGSISDYDIFRMPSGYLANDFEFSVDGVGTVKEVKIDKTPSLV